MCLLYRRFYYSRKMQNIPFALVEAKLLENKLSHYTSTVPINKRLLSSPLI